MCAIDEGEQSNRISCDHPTARKMHTCGECGRLIQPGEKYERDVSVWEGEWHRQKTCIHCEAARSWLEVNCQGWVWGMVLEDLEEHWENIDYRSFDLGRKIIGMRRRWFGSHGLWRVPRETVRPVA